MRRCSKCDVLKEESEFYSKRPDCKVCKRKTTKQNYDENVEVRVSYSKERRNTMKLKCIEHLGGSCVDCGGVFHQACYDFHHIDPTEKEGNIGELLSSSFDKIVLELDKCVLLCSNCHRIRHFI